MSRMAVAIAVALALAAPVRAGVEVTAVGDRLDVHAARVPLSEVLDGLARKTKMKVVYEGAAPRTVVSVSLTGRTPAEAVLGVLEGLGVDFALILNDAGTEVETLMIVGPGSASPPRAASSSSAAAPPHATADNPGFDDAPQLEVEQAQVKGEPHEVPQDPPTPAPPQFGPVNPPAVNFPTSPFAPGPPKALPPPPPSPAPSPATNR